MRSSPKARTSNSDAGRVGLLGKIQFDYTGSATAVAPNNKERQDG